MNQDQTKEDLVKELCKAFEFLLRASRPEREEPRNVLIELGCGVLDARLALAKRKVYCGDFDRALMSDHAWMLFPALHNNPILDQHRKALKDAYIPTHDLLYLRRQSWMRWYDQQREYDERINRAEELHQTINNKIRASVAL